MAGIVPVDVPLIIVVDNDLLHIDQAKVGQFVMVRFPNFTARTVPEVGGRIAGVSPDTMPEPATGQRPFAAEVELTPAKVAEPILAQLTAGMPVEAVARTDARLPMSFLLKPPADDFACQTRQEVGGVYHGGALGEVSDSRGLA